MSYIDKNLLANEAILYRTRKHWIIFLVPFLWLVAFFFFYFNSNSYVVVASFIPALSFLITFLYTALTYFTSEYAITNKRVMMREGFFIRRTNETRLSTLAKVSVTQSLIGQWLNYGVVGINAFGGDVESFTDISSPVAFQKEAQEQLNQLTRQSF